MNCIKSARFLHRHKAVSPFPPANPVDDQENPLPETYSAYTVWSVLIVSFIAGGIIGGLAVFFLIAHLNGETVDSSLPLPTHKAPAIDTRLPEPYNVPNPVLI